MQIRYKYLLWVNGVLLVLWTVYILTEQVWDRRDMLRIEADNLQCLARVVRTSCFRYGQPKPCLPRMVTILAQVHSGTEIMVVDRRSRVTASSIAERMGRTWKEPIIDQVFDQSQPSAWQYQEHYHGELAVLDVTVPVTDASSKPTHAIHVARRMDLVMELLREHRAHNTAWALVSLVLIGVVLSLVTYRWLIQPINRITRVLAGSRWYKKKERAGDEMQRLLEAIRQLVRDAEQAMAERESFSRKLEQEVRKVREELTRTQDQLVRKERLSAVGELAAALAHELRNPLHIIRGDAERLSGRPDSTAAGKDILEEVDRINRFVNELLDYTRDVAPSTEGAQVAPVVRGVVETEQRIHPNSEVVISVDCPDDLFVEMGADHLHQVLINLVSNAVEAMDGQGRLTVTVTPLSDSVRLAVSDTGRGIAEQDLERIFDPFFTRRPAGTGLGLSVVRRLIDLYCGNIHVTSQPGKGTEVSFYLPGGPAR